MVPIMNSERARLEGTRACELLMMSGGKGDDGWLGEKATARVSTPRPLHSRLYYDDGRKDGRSLLRRGMWGRGQCCK